MKVLGRKQIRSVLGLVFLCAAPGFGQSLPNPILFVTQVPIPADFATIGSVFANHLPSLQEVGRGGDLYIRYPDGTLRNLTAEAGYGTAGFQGGGGIAARDPHVHWSGDRALFSMVVGATEQQYEWQTYFWQIYEITGLGVGETVQIEQLSQQPAQANNVTPVYLSDGRILFSSDRPHNSQQHLYPQLDEYESTATITGLWALDPANGALQLFNHAPSGVFTPILDSFGRVVFTRWDHLQQDQQADADALYGDTNGSFDYAGEAVDAQRLARADEIFPEPRGERPDLLAGTPFLGHTLNRFLPWQIHQDGSAEEMLNHLGRHELVDYFDRARHDDGNLFEFIDSVSGRVNPSSIGNLLQMREQPTTAGGFVGTDAPEFATHAAGQLVRLVAPPQLNPDLVVVEPLTHPSTRDVVGDGGTPPAAHSGHYRDPLPLTDGSLLAAHTDETRAADNEGSRANPVPRYRFRLRMLTAAGNGYLEAGAALTAGITKTVSYWDPDVLVSYSSELWELQPVEVRSRPQPPLTGSTLESPEQQVFQSLALQPQALRDWMRERDLALLVVRNATTRDAADRQQPFNLRVPGGVQTVATGGTVYDIAYLQLFQGDLVRGYGGIASPDPGRRVLARLLHEPDAVASNPPLPGSSPPASVALAADGSAAAFVPAGRALAWQTTAPNGDPVVRERFWITLQPGEIRACDGCHGVNTSNQIGGTAAQQAPAALEQLLRRWLDVIFDDGFEEGLRRWSSTQPEPREPGETRWSRPPR